MLTEKQLQEEIEERNDYLLRYCNDIQNIIKAGDYTNSIRYARLILSYTTQIGTLNEILNGDESNEITD